MAAPVEYHVPQARLPFLKTAPALDGEVHVEEWAGAARMEGLGYGPTLSPQAASFWVGCACTSGATSSACASQP